MAGINSIAKEAGQKTEAVKGAFSGLKALLQKGEVVSIEGFGSFRVTDRKATTATNPKTGAKLSVPAQKVVRFKASHTLRGELNPSLAKAKPAPKAKAPAPAAPANPAPVGK